MLFEEKKPRCELRLITTQAIKNGHYSHELGDSLLSQSVTHSFLQRPCRYKCQLS